MTALIMRNYGGMQPSANPKGLPDSAATLARDLELRFGDFRPLPTPAAQAVVAAGGTLYRFHGSPDFITNPGSVNYVRGPIPNDALERTYYTGDGAPKVITIGKEIRRLGVPAPAGAPAVVVNVTDQYSTDDAAADQAKKLQEMVDAARGGMDKPYDGVPLDELADRFMAVPADDPQGAYAFIIPGAMSGGSFVPTNAAHANLISDDLGFYLGTKDGATVGLVDLEVRAQTIKLRDDFPSRFQTITDPSDSTGAKKLLNVEQIETIKSTLRDGLTTADNVLATNAPRLLALKKQFVAVADSGSAAVAANFAAVQAFYERAEVTADIDAAVKQAVSAIYGAMFTYNNTAYDYPVTGGGGKNNPFEQQEQM